MESNTPVTPQRRRRAGSATALPSSLPLVVPDEYAGAAPQQNPAAAPAPSPVTATPRQEPVARPAVPVPAALAQQRTVARPYPQQEYRGYPTAAGTPHQSPSACAMPQAGTAAPLTEHSVRHAPPRPAYPGALPQDRPSATQGVQRSAAPQNRYAAAPRPAAQTSARPAQNIRPAGARPQAYGEPDLFRRDAEAAPRRKPVPPQKADAWITEDAPAKKSSIPSWLWTVFGVAVIAVMLLAAGSALMMAKLKTEADKFEKAWDSILYNYHITEQSDGTFRVTWQEHIERYAEMYNLDPAFVTAIIRNESSFRTEATSGVGARGLMQMMPDTAQWIAGKLGEPYDFDRLYEAETSIRYGCWYLDFLSDLFQGDTVLVCAAYHAGQGEVLGWLGNPAISPDGVNIPIENIPISNTKTYAERVTKAYGIYKTLLYSPDPSAAAAVYGADPSVADVLPGR